MEDAGGEEGQPVETGAGQHSTSPAQEPSQPPPDECSRALAAAEEALGAERFDEALESFRSAIASLRTEPRLPPELQSLELQLLDGVAASLQKAGKEDEALEAHMATMAQAASYQRELDEAMSCLAVADIYAERGVTSGLGDAVRLLKLSDNVNSQMIGGVGGTRVPTLEQILHQVDAGEFAVEDAPPAVAEFVKSEEVAASWKRCTGEQCFGGNLAVLESIQWFERMVHLAAKVGAADIRAQGLGSLGTIYAKLKQPQIAARLFREVITYGQKEDDHRAVANAATGLGKAHDALAYKHLQTNWLEFTHQQIRAIEAHEMARGSYSAIADVAEVAQSYFRIANGYALMREHHEAIAKLRFAKQAAKTCKDAAVEADALREIGLQYQLLAQHRSAVEVHEADYEAQVRQKSRIYPIKVTHHTPKEPPNTCGAQMKLKNTAGLGRASRHLAISHRALGGHKKALKLTTFALKVAEEEQDKEAIALALIELGACYAATHQVNRFANENREKNLTCPQKKSPL